MMQKQEKEPIETPMTEAEIERLKRDIYRPDGKIQTVYADAAEECTSEKSRYTS